MAPSSLQLARLVQAYVAEPGGSIEEKAARVGLRRNELLRAARGSISRTVRGRLLAFFAAAGAPRRPGGSAPAGPRPGGARRRTRARRRGRRHERAPAVLP